jgi:hypothetical protein
VAAFTSNSPQCICVPRAAIPSSLQAR